MVAPSGSARSDLGGSLLRRLYIFFALLAARTATGPTRRMPRR